ncbi:hypothetical protein SNE510_62510 [Streptomyces sp. NE5-10]|uniref:3-oxoacyl-[acyl-carrier-protein] synthase III C-terminal domain-containing protein n=1 Tax=Streptomyces sp. NE5-10 TaxID=2759674 RepID=UPI001908A834|nr:3-oxoacyl-[acyl-carrier-protein] synthase III C-terminal domain-containing protein [Streptomyces sp. NE5-10]GHJ96732.1 hypothetical protein SNE510_62510 [Streptomyces sp. NE5-10]
MRLDDLHIAGVATRLPKRFPVERAVEPGLYDAEDAAQGDWVSVAVACETSPPDLAARAGRLALERSGLDTADIARVTHMNGAHERFPRRTPAPIGPETWRGTLEFSRRAGHLGAGDQVAGFDHLLETGAPAPGDHVLMIGVGTGISISCVVLRIDERPSWVV